MRAAGYTRVSSTEQVNNGTSLETQRKQIEAYCTMKGIELVSIFSDEGVSGSKPIADRPEGARLTEMTEKGDVQAIIIVKLDRGFRNVVDCLQSVDSWERKGISLHIVDLGGNSIDTTSPAGRFMLTVLSAAGEMERGMINDRCNAGRRARKAEGKRIGEIPFGFQVAEDGKTLIENATEQEVIATCNQLRARGMTIRQIVSELTSRGIVTRGNRATWSTSQVFKILKRAA
jgi:site-specific DNA recombinase